MHGERIASLPTCLFFSKSPRISLRRAPENSQVGNGKPEKWKGADVEWQGWGPFKIRILGGGFKYFLCSPRTLGKMNQFDEHIFQMGWFNHQPVYVTFPKLKLKLRELLCPFSSRKRRFCRDPRSPWQFLMTCSLRLVHNKWWWFVRESPPNIFFERFSFRTLPRNLPRNMVITRNIHGFEVVVSVRMTPNPVEVEVEVEAF